MRFVATLALGVCSVATAQVPVATNRVSTASSVFVAQPPGETHRLYTVRPDGYLFVVNDGALQTTPFLYVPFVYYSAESGLLGLAFHPQFQSNGYFYVYYMNAIPPLGVRIVRYRTDPANPNIADPASATPVLLIPRQTGFHFGGWMGFGPDGFLYIAVGNAGGLATSPSLETLLGKMLRIDVDHDDFPADPATNYAVPVSNPLFGSSTNRSEIWAYGLRNPWRNSFDRETGDLWIGDVGDFRAGEINFQSAGLSNLRHYGYPCMDGTSCTGLGGCTCNDPALTLPIHDIATPGATIGGYVYRGNAIPALRGTYIFGDYLGQFWSFRYNGAAITELTDRTAEFAIPLNSTVTSFAEDSSGELYICTQYKGFFKIVPPCPANCDNSNIEPRLNINDFQCFLNKFAAADPTANCDHNTQPPLLTAADFTCFLNLYAAGCP